MKYSHKNEMIENVLTITDLSSLHIYVFIGLFVICFFFINQKACSVRLRSSSLTCLLNKTLYVFLKKTMDCFYTTYERFHSFAQMPFNEFCSAG